jgi:hypothetical protein
LSGDDDVAGVDDDDDDDAYADANAADTAVTRCVSERASTITCVVGANSHTPPPLPPPVSAYTRNIRRKLPWPTTTTSAARV